MTEKKQLREQMALHTYKRPANMARSLNKGEKHEAARTLQRVVTVPQSDPSAAWNTFAQRQAQRRRTREKPRKYVEMAPRTYAQTGMWASSGRIKAVRRLPQYGSSPIPVRSGHRTLRRSFWWRLLSMFTIVVLFGLAVNFALTSNAFRIEQVNVVGTHNDALVQAIQGMGMRGQNIFLLNIAALTEHVETFPLVAAANLSKQWPNQLLITVVERVPVLLWQTPQGTYSVDSQGVVIAPANQTAGADHLGTVVDSTNQSQGNGRTGKATAQLHPGAHLNQSDVAFAQTVFDHLSQVTGISTFKLRYDGTMYASTTNDLNSRGSYIVESPDGWIAYLGGAHDANPLDNRLVELQQILALAKSQQLNLATIDLRYGLRPVYTLKQ